jgi:N-acetylmuramoyl-L-alanine amidase
MRVTGQAGAIVPATARPVRLQRRSPKRRSPKRRSPKRRSPKRRSPNPGTAIAGIASLSAAVLLCAGCAGVAGARPASGGSSPDSSSPSSPAAATATPTATPAAALPLAGKVVGIDPGHNGGNFTHPAYLARQIWNGREYEDCDTTGTETAGGYTEARFNFNVATYLAADLVAEGARVVMTRHTDTGVGPCVNTRSRIINRSHAEVAIDIHADGGPVTGRGFTVLEPVADGPNDAVIRSSIRFGADVRAAMLTYTSMPESDYYGHDGLIFRDDLAGLNLTTVPKVLVECGNMRNPTDAALLTRPSFQRLIARAFAAAITRFLTGGTTTG